MTRFKKKLSKVANLMALIFSSQRNSPIIWPEFSPKNVFSLIKKNLKGNRSPKFFLLKLLKAINVFCFLAFATFYVRSQITKTWTWITPRNKNQKMTNKHKQYESKENTEILNLYRPKRWIKTEQDTKIFQIQINWNQIKE